MVSVLIPCFNEEDSLSLFESELFPALDRLNQAYELIAIDDGSADGTRRVLAKLADSHKEIRILRHEKNRGLGAALRSGIQQAHGSLLVALDADLTFPPTSLYSLLKTQRDAQADCVTGSPFLERALNGVPLRRRLPSAVLNRIYRSFFDPNISSYTPMFRLYRTESLRSLPLISDGFEISSEILVRMLQAGMRIVEIPVPLMSRRTGASKLRPWRELKAHARLIYHLLKN